MAEGKNSIVVYRDWIDIFDDLEDDEAGRLIKHFFRYVNDLNPESPDRLTSLLFKQIKSTLKRDLKKWEDKSLINRENALKRWHKNNANAYERKKRNANNADSVSDSDSDSDSVSDKFNFKKELISLGVDDEILSDWMQVRKTKKASNTKTAFNSIKSQIEKSGLTANECIKIAVEKDWKGFNASWLNNDKQDQPLTCAPPNKFKGYN